MFVVAVAFLAGIVLVQFVPHLPGFAWMWLLCLPLGLAGYWRILPLAVFTLGVAWAWLYAGHLLAQQLPAEWEGRDLLVKGYIEGLPEQLPRGAQRMRFRIASIQVDQAWQAYPLTTRLTWYHGPPADLEPGAAWQLIVRMKRPSGFANPGGFDYEGWLFQHGIRASGYVRKDTRNRHLGDAHPAIVSRWRLALREYLRDATGNTITAPLVQALALGVRDDMTAAHWTVLRRTGTSHLMAISGLHISLVAGVLFWLTRRGWGLLGLNAWVPAGVVAAFCGLAGALVYGAMAGFTVPTRRAVIMVAVVMLALASRRPIRPFHSLGLALLVVLLLDPLSVLQAGFWLSFAAVGLLLLVFSGQDLQGRYWWSLLRTQWVLFLGLAPLSLGIFGELSLLAPLANLVAVPVVGLLVVPLVLLGCLCVPVNLDVARLFWLSGDSLLQWLWILLDWCSDLAIASWAVLASGTLIWLCVALATLVLLFARRWHMRSLGLVFLLPALVAVRSGPGPGEMWLDLLDVGQGLAAVVRTRNHVLVYDTGPRYPSGFNTGDAVLVPFLRGHGIAEIDRLVISHGDNDHIGGARPLDQAVFAHGVLTSVPESVNWRPSRRCHTGQRWEWDGVRFEMLAPGSAAPAGNNRSCVLRVQSGKHQVLLPGDIERSTENWLLRHAGDRLRSTVLVAPHHGSATSSSPGFIAAVRPQYVLFPAGYRNRWGFPRPEVAARYRESDAVALSTADVGAIHIHFNGDDSPVVSGYRLLAPRYWHRPL